MEMGFFVFLKDIVEIDKYQFEDYIEYLFYQQVSLIHFVFFDRIVQENLPSTSDH